MWVNAEIGDPVVGLPVWGLATSLKVITKLLFALWVMGLMLTKSTKVKIVKYF